MTEYRSSLLKLLRERGYIHQATDDSNLPIVSILIGLGFVDSKAEARRKIGEGAVRVNGEVVSDPMSVVTTDAEPVKISLGKKKHGLLTRS